MAENGLEFGEGASADYELVELSPEERQKAQRIHANVINKLFTPLSEVEKQVLSLRWGLANGYDMTLKEVGLELGMSRTTAWRIENRAFGKLRQTVSEKHRRFLDQHGL